MDFANPFTNRSIILDPDQFIGRKYQIEDILNRVKNGDSVSIVGERRIGKSSLQYHLMQKGNSTLHDEQLMFKYVDLTDPRFNTPEKFCMEVGKLFGVECSSAITNALIHLADVIEKLNENRKTPVFLLDEFEKITEKPQVFTNAFFDALRSFANRHLAVFITAGQHTLSDLWRMQQLTSPFFNIFYTLSLDEFEVSDMANDVQEFLDRFWLQRLAPSGEELALLVSYCSRHPLVMQVVSYWVFENRKLQLGESALKEKIEDELKGYFPSAADSIRKWLRKDLSRHLTGLNKTAEQIGAIVKNLSPLALNFTQK
jgi:uncharacterized protein